MAGTASILPGVAVSFFIIAGIAAYFSFVSRAAFAEHYYAQFLKKEHGKGRAFAYKNDMTAVEPLLKAITYTPSNAQYHYRLGKFYSGLLPTTTSRYMLSALSCTMNAYKKAVELNPADARYRRSLAWAYGQLYGFCRAYCAAQAERENAYPLDAGEWKRKAMAEFGRAIASAPNSAYGYRAYARWLLLYPDEDALEQGLRYYEKAVELQPELGEEYRHYIRSVEDRQAAGPVGEKIVPCAGDTPVG